MAGLRHYVYYRVADTDLAAAVAAVTAAQQRLCDAHAGLAADCLRRPGAKDGLVTLMEVYAFGPAHDAGAVEADAAAASAPWRRGDRHLEVFVPAGGAATG